MARQVGHIPVSVDEYIHSCKSVLRKINKLEAKFAFADETLREEWVDQIERLIWNFLEMLLKCTTKKQALQITAISKRFNKHKALLEDLGVNFP